MIRSRFPRTTPPLVAALALLILTSVTQPIQAQDVDSSHVARFQLADSYMRAGQYDRAIVILEDLHAAAPTTYAFYHRLKEAYEAVKRYDEAVGLVMDAMERERTPVVVSDLARLYFLQGDEEHAHATWDEAIDLEPDNPNTYRLVHQSLLEVRQFQKAIEVLERAREALRNPQLYHVDLAYLYNLTGQHESAMEEHLALLRENERQVGFVRSRLSRFIEYEDVLQSSMGVVSAAVRREPLNRAFRELLGWLQVEAGNFREAYDSYRAIDRLEQEDGQTLLTFAEMASDAGAFDVASEAYQEVLERHQEAPSAPLALAGLGALHERWAEDQVERIHVGYESQGSTPHYDMALEAYRTFAQRYPTHQNRAEVLRRIGRLQQDVFHQLEAAESTLREVLARYPNTRAADEAEFDLARASVMRGNLDEARLRFARLEERLRTGDLADLTRFKMAEIHFFAGEFTAAEAFLSVIDANTSADVSNDAIGLRIVLLENRGPDSLHTPLRVYARARLAKEQNQLQRAVDTLNELLAGYPGHGIVDEARFLRADLLRRMGRSHAAHQAFAELPLLHPRSYLADRALFAAAEIQERELGEAEAAIELYTRLLSDFPGSLFAAQARERIRRLRGDGV